MGTTTDEANASKLPIWARLQIQVVASQIMTGWTVSLRAVRRAYTNPSEDINSKRDGLHVFWIATSAIAAQMIQLFKANWRRGNKNLVGNTMGIHQATRSDREVTIASLGQRTGPVPASTVRPNINFSPEAGSNQRGYRGEWHCFHGVSIPRMGLGV